MAGIIEVGSRSALTVYVIIHDNTGKVWDGANFVIFNAPDWATYAIALTEQAGTGYYVGTFPALIGSGKYTVVAYRQYGGSPATSDGASGPLAVGAIYWTGAKEEQGVGLVLVDYKLDKVASAAAAGTPTIGSYFDQIMNKNAGQTFDQTTDSLEAIKDAGTTGPTAADIADAVWDEVIDGSNHATANSGGERLKRIDDVLPSSGTISNFDKSSDTVQLAANQSGVTVGTVNQLGTQAKADVRQQVSDALGVDQLSELTAGAPPATPTIKQAVMFLFMALRNKRIATASEEKIYDNSGSAIAKATISDDGTTTTKEQFTAP